MRNSMRTVLGCIICAAILLGSNAFANPAVEKEAVSSAQAWLALIDAGKYAESWNESAQLFRSSITKDQWSSQLTAARKPLGKMLSRKVKSTQYTKTLPGAPDGEYVVIQFDVSYENKKSAVETVTPMKDKDGRMRVSGYYIK